MLGRREPSGEEIARRAHDQGPCTIGCRLNQSIRLARGSDLRQGEMIALIKVELILNL
jgi:hypothetical protein